MSLRIASIANDAIRKLIASCAALAFVLPNTAAADSAWTSGGEFSLGYDSNINNAPVGQTEIGSGFAEAGAHLDHRLALSEDASLLLRGNLNVQDYATRHSLANVKAGVLTRLLLRPGKGLLTPTLIGSVSAARWEFNSDMRDGSEYRGLVALRQRLNTQMSLRISAGVSRREGRSAVFDLKVRLGGLDLEWQPRPRGNLHAGYQYLRGDVVATSLPGPTIRDIAEVIELDDAFDGNVTNQRAYRFNAQTRIATLGFNYAISPALSLDTQMQYIRVRSEDADIRYTRYIGSAGLLWRFQ